MKKNTLLILTFVIFNILMSLVDKLFFDVNVTLGSIALYIHIIILYIFPYEKAIK